MRSECEIRPAWKDLCLDDWLMMFNLYAYFFLFSVLAYDYFNPGFIDGVAL